MKLPALALCLTLFLASTWSTSAAAQTPPAGPAGAGAAAGPAPTVAKGTELRRYLQQPNRVLVKRLAPQPPVPVEGGQVTVSGLGVFEPGLESQRLLGLRVRVEAPGLEGPEQIHYLDLHEIESLLRGVALLRTVIIEGGRGFPTAARHVSIEGFGVGISLLDGEVGYLVHAGPNGDRAFGLSQDGFQKLENALSTALDRLFNAP